MQKESSELNKFTKLVDSYTGYQIQTTKFGILNSFLPTMFTFSSFVCFLAFTPFSTSISLDFIGVTETFQSLGTVTKKIN